MFLLSCFIVWELFWNTDSCRVTHIKKSISYQIMAMNGPPPDLQVMAWSPKQSIVSPHLLPQSLLKRGMPNQCLRTAENWLSSKYLNDWELGAAESPFAALSDETDRSLAFSLAGKSGFESVTARWHLSMHDEKLFVVVAGFYKHFEYLLQPESPQRTGI